MVKMLISLMLPFSLVEKEAWKKFIKVFDPQFWVPTRKTLKGTWLNTIHSNVEIRIKKIIEHLPYVNVSVDGWSDGVMRCFNGYICQGIDGNWDMQTIAIAFQFVKGRHTGKAIKSQYDQISEIYNIQNKTFKIVADQAANVKKAFVDTLETEDVLTITTNLMRRQRKSDELAEAERIAKELEAQQVGELNKSIEFMNAPSDTAGTLSKKRKVEQVLLELLEEEDQYEDTDELDIQDEELDDTIGDAESLNEEEGEDDEEEQKYAYEPCACHNIQLVLKDGFAQVPGFELLIKKITKNIVNRSKFSALIWQPPLATIALRWSLRIHRPKT